MIEEGDIVLCTVDRIVGTVVFVKIEGEEKEGSIILSEIAPGRIRNLREYVVPRKKIVCKVLKETRDTFALSLRRVTQKEKKELLEEYNQEKSYINVLKSVLKEKAEKIIKEISKKQRVYDFLQNAKENSKELEKLAGKGNSEKIIKIISEQRKRKTALKKIIFLKTTAPNGLELIKEILKKPENIEIKYLAAGKYSLKTEGENPKKQDMELKEFLKKAEQKAKKLGVSFEVKEK